MSVCIFKSNPDYQALVNGSNYTENTIDYIVNSYWQEHPEKAVEGKEEYPSLDYVNNFFETATSVATSAEDIKLWRRFHRDTYDIASLESATRTKEDFDAQYGQGAALMWQTKDGMYHVKVARPILSDPTRGFQFNREQKYAVAKISDWFMDRQEGKVNDNWIVLEGEAGTGKTSIINDILINAPTLYNSAVVTGAVSNQATDNIIDKLSDEVTSLFNIKRKTVASMLGLKQDTSTEKKGFVEDSFTKKELFSSNIAIIDEASMVTEQFLDYVKEAAKSGIPVLFIGDAAQINPIREGEYFDQHPEIDKSSPAPVFASKDAHTVLSLKERVRQGEDSPILDLASAYRKSWENNTPIPSMRGLKSSADGRLTFTRMSVNPLLDKLIPIFQEAIKQNNPNLIHIVPYHRDYKKDSYGNIIGIQPRSALWWNQKIYDALHPEFKGQYVFQPGDLVRFDESYTIDENNIIPNSENAQVVSTSEERKDSYGVRFRNVTIKLSDGNEITVPVVAQDTAGQQLFLDAKKKLFSEARKLFGVERKTAYQKAWEYLNSYAQLTFSYALNVHRAQGSTYDITILDQDDIDSVRRMYESKGDNRQLASLGYTAATRAKNALLVMTMQADNPDMKVDLLAVNKLFNGARNKKPVTIERGDSTQLNKQLNGNQTTATHATEKPLNVVSSNPETNILSNFADRPFSPGIPERDYNTGNTVPYNYHRASVIFTGGRQFRTVEGAFQAAKMAYADGYIDESGDLTPKGEIALKVFQEGTGAEARRAGRALEGLDSAAWDNVSSDIMYNLLKESFLQNDDAAEALRKTGTKPLTHSIPDTGKSNFIGNLTKLRDELVRETRGALNIDQNSPFGKIVFKAMKTVERDEVLASMPNEGTLPGKEPQSVAEVLAAIANGTLDTNASEEHKQLAAALIPLVTRLGGKINFDEFKGNFAGRTYGKTPAEGNNIAINTKVPKISVFPARTILHEVTHLLSIVLLNEDKVLRSGVNQLRNYTIDYIKNTASGGKLQTKEYTFFDEEQGRYSKHVLNFDIYGLSTVDEFLAEALGNPDFQEVLKQIPAPQKKSLSIWDKIVDYVTNAFSRIFKKEYKVNESVYDQLKPIIAYTLEAGSYNIDLDSEELKGRNKELSDEQLREANTLLQLRPSEVFAGVSESQATINSAKTILSNEELKYWNEHGVGDNPRILVGSEHSDPVFHTKQILDIINGKGAVRDHKGNMLTGHDFAGLYLITKHDGLPMLELLETKIPKLIHFSITTLGGTEYEPGVMKYNDLLDRIEEYIKQGLDPESVTIRIDPIVPGVTNFTDIEEVVKRASAMGIKRIRFSVMDAYRHTVEEMSKRGYDFEKYYGTMPNGRVNFSAKPEFMNAIFDFMLSLKDKYNVTLGTCAEFTGREGINKEGCLSVNAVNSMLGTSIPDLGTNNNAQRPLCSCYGGKIDALAYGDNCASHCVYCYAKHANDKALEYYDADGKLKDNKFTRTRRDEAFNAPDKPAPNIQKAVTYLVSQEQMQPQDAKKFNSVVSFTPIVEAGDAAIAASVKEDVQSGRLPIGTKITVNAGSTITELTKAVRILRKLSDSFVYEGLPVPVSVDNFDERQLKELDKNGIKNDGKNVLIPSFSVGLSERELSDIAKRERVNNYKLLTPTEIRALGVKAMWKVSDIVSKLQTGGVNASREFLKNIDGLQDTDFTGMERLEIIRKVGIGRLLDAARDILFAPENTDSPRELAKKQFIRENYNIIYEQAQDVLAQNEEITLTGNSRQLVAQTAEVGGILPEQINTETMQEVLELVGSAAEHWQVGFRQVSAASSLAAIVRRTLFSLLDLDANGNAIQEAYGPKTLDVHQAVVDMLNWASGSKTSDEMIARLQAQMPTNPWLRQLVGEYHEDGDPNKPMKQGILVNPDNGQLKSRFFTNFSKYFQAYIVMYKDDEGNTRLREINTKQFTEGTLDDIRTAEEHKSFGYLRVWDAEGGLSDDFRKFQSIVGDVAYTDKATGTRHEATGMQAVVDKVTKQDLENLQTALGILNIQAPSVEELSMIFGEDNVNEYADVARRLRYIEIEIRKRADAYSKNPKNEFSLLGGSNTIKNNIENILKKLAPVMHTNMEAVSYEAGKMHYGYVQPSYLNMHIADLKGTGMTDEQYARFIQHNFKNYAGWFYNDGTNQNLAGSGWLNEWMEMLVANKQWRDMLQHVASLAYEGTGYTDKINPQMGASLLFAYFYDANEAYAYYRVLLLSNKPSEEYIRFARFKSGYEQHILDNVRDRTLPAEINRIRTVLDRLKKVNEGKLSKDVLIENLETGGKNGTQFYFLKFLNDEIKNDTALGNATVRLISGELAADPTNPAWVSYKTLFDNGFKAFMESRFQEFLDNFEADGTITREDGVITAVYGVQDKVGTHARAMENLREFFFNDWYAQLNMQQILFGDPAQYSNAEDLQKRAAQLHSPGMRPDLSAKDIKTGQLITDGFERFLVLDDIIKPSEAVGILEGIHKRILSDPKFSNSDGTLTELGKEKNALLKKIRSLFEEDNVTDGQAVISPTGLRKIMHMFGKWDWHMQEVFDKIFNGDDITSADLDVVWPVIKPFSYSTIAKNTYSKYMPFFNVGIQQKNSMFPIILAGALSRSVGEDNAFRALYDVMEESARNNGNVTNNGIDAILFKSNLKTGASGSTDISNMTPDEIRSTLRERMRAVQGQKNIDGEQRLYNEDYVYEIPWSDWSQQQEVPNEFDGTQQKGSQQRPLTIADTANTSIDANGNEIENTVRVNLPGKGWTEMTVREAKKLYLSAHAENIDMAASILSEELALDTNNRKLRNIALSRLLVEELRRDGRYGADIIRAVSVDKEGEFITPLSDPMLAGTLQQLLNSLIKNRVYKQQIAGGPLVQVSSFGLSKELKIRYNKAGTKPLYAEVMVSAPEEWYENKDFLDENGELSIKKIEELCPEALLMIGYRIPTEAKYSMLPMKIVGFLPRSTQSIMLPKEITVLSGSDFDVDKMYIMRTVFEKRKDGEYTINVKDKYSKNNNTALSIAWAFLTAAENADQTISAGQFDELKRTAYTIASADNVDKSVEDVSGEVAKLKDKSVKELKSSAYRSTDLMFADSQIKFFHQNMVAGKLIGVFAQANISHAFVSMMRDGTFVPTVMISDGLKLNLRDATGATHQLSGEVEIDPEFDWTGLKRISAAFAECIGASVDAVKDPTFNLMNVNMVTVNVFSTMLRFGWDKDSLAWFLTTPIIKELVKQYELVNAEGSATIEEIIAKLKHQVSEGRPMTFDENHAWGMDDFIKMHRLAVTPTKKAGETDDQFLIRKTDEAHRNWQLLELFSRMQGLADVTRSIVHATRYNSISAAPGPFAANTFVNDLKLEKFIGMRALDGVKGVIDNPILRSFIWRTQNLVQKVLGENLVQAGPMARTVYETMENLFGYINDDLAMKMSEFMPTYLVNLNNPVFDLSYENRRNMLLGFPNLFISARTRYPDNVLLKSIHKKGENTKPYLELKTRGLEDKDISELTAAWDTLFKQEQQRLAKGGDLNGLDKENLAIKLVEYMFFRGGFGFDPRTCMRLVPESIKDALPNYRENTRKLTGMDPESVDIKNMIFQFMLNYGKTNMPLQDSLPIQKTSNGDLFVSEKDGQAALLKNEGIVGVRSGKNISYYYVKYDIKAGVYNLTKVSKLGGNKFGFEIDPNRDFRNIKSSFDTVVTQQEGSQQTPEDSVGDLDAMLFKSAGTPTTTVKLINKVLGAEWASRYSDAYGAFKDMTDKFFDFRVNYGVDDMTDNDTFVAQELSKIDFNLPKEEVQKMMVRVAKRLDEQNICR